MDQTQKPLAIPPSFALYAERHGIFDIYQNMLSELLIHKPSDPIQFLTELLEKDSTCVPKVLVLGPPASGKLTVGKMLSGRLRCPHLTMRTIIQDCDRELREKAEFYLSENQPIPTELWIKIIQNRLGIHDCVRKGWVLSGFPQTREQAIALQTAGIFPRHTVLLNCADSVLIERAVGKRMDSDTGDIYHINFDPPTDDFVVEKLVEVPGNTNEEIKSRLAIYNRAIIDLAPCFNACAKNIDADQPVADVFYQAFDFVRSPARSVAPRNPRVILIGPPGSGRDTQASLLAAKYDLVNINCGNLLRQAVASESKAGLAIKNYIERHLPVPDAMLLKILKEKLSEIDSVTKGWVLHGYPRTQSQAEQLTNAGFVPNRIFFLELSNATVLERLTNRLTDPVTGKRYHRQYNPPTDKDVITRIVVHPRDNEVEVNRRLSRFSTFQEELRHYYENTAQTVNADQDIHTIFETVESFIVRPIPMQYA